MLLSSGLRLKIDLRNPFVLEVTKLWLCKDLSDSPLMTILDAATRCRLGTVREVGSGWFAPRALEVFELEDESLVFHMQRGWFTGWAVTDAEGQRVGRVAGCGMFARLEDSAGRSFAALRVAAESTRIVADDSRELGRLEAGSGGVEVSFAAEVAGEPFLKMLVLAAAIRGNL